MERLNEEKMLELAAKATGKIEHHGERGPSLISYPEIEAMSMALVFLGVVPWRPSLPKPDRLFVPLSERLEGTKS